MFLGAAGLVEEVLEFVDFGVKTVVQSKASLIAAKSGRQKNFGGFVIRFIKNIQPISVGV